MSRPPHLLLLSLGLGAVPEFLARFIGDTPGATVGYLDDAAVPWEELGSPAAGDRRDVDLFGCSFTPITAGALSRAEFTERIDGVAAVYVAGGNTFSLLAGLRRHGADEVLRDRILGGLPYLGYSAGAVVAGPDIEPASLLDAPPPDGALTDLRGLDIIDTVPIPHADGALAEYPPELIDATVQRYGRRFPLTLLRDDQALLVDGQTARIIPSP